MRADFDALAAFGATPKGGVSRPSLGEAHLAARAWFLRRSQEAGLETRVDAAGNHSAILRSGRSAAAPTLLLGSHLDSVPDGGRYDGALGVVAALHVLLAVQKAGADLSVALEAIDFTDEEGTLVGLLGSEAVAGTLTAESLRAPRGGREALLAGLELAGLHEERLAEARREPASLAGYLELHIEQGPRLEQEGAQIGVVTGIVGARSFSLVFRGAARHAGTTPMGARRDAGLGAAAFAVAANAVVARDFPGCVATVGDLRLEPGAFNVVPGSARVALELRSPDAVQLDELESALLGEAGLAAEQHALGLEAIPVGSWEPTALDPGVRAAIRRAAAALGLSTLELVSGAGHDAQALAGVTRSGMIFVPSVAGISHDAGEHTRWEDCVHGADALLGAALALALGE
ncbi:MAG TPA: Zn-dependent hydrolase [Gaiellaceae bacterium]|jgi:N-carbamoyl-L-amino-acid hydrolase|nr:Zn-dependent hydrolase [Gaiellaceae bacterium]